jgi:hypothetical protein
MKTIYRTLDIPKNHQVTLPRSIPIAKAKMVLVIHPTLLEVATISKEESLLKLAGTLKKSPNFNGDSVQLQKKSV